MKEISKTLEILAYVCLVFTFLFLNILNKTITIYSCMTAFVLFVLSLIVNVIFYTKNKKRRTLSKIFSIIATIFFLISILNLKDINIIALAISLGIASLNLIGSNIVLLTSNESIERTEDEKRKINSSLRILLILFALFIVSLCFNIDILFCIFFILLIIEIIYLKFKYPEDDKINGILNLIISLTVLGFIFLMFALKFMVELIKWIIGFFVEWIKNT